MTIPALLCNCKITVQNNTPVDTDGGGRTASWANDTNYVTKPAMIKLLNQTDAFFDDQTQPTFTHKIYVNNFGTISSTNTQIIVDGTTTHKVVLSDYADGHWEITTRIVKR